MITFTCTLCRVVLAITGGYDPEVIRAALVRLGWNEAGTACERCREKKGADQ